MRSEVKGSGRDAPFVLFHFAPCKKVLIITGMNRNHYVGMVLAVLMCLPSALVGQSRQDIANLIQDVDLMRREMARLSYDLQEAQRENSTLKAKLNVVESRLDTVTANVSNVRSEMESRLADFRTQVEEANKKQKEQIISNITEQIEQFATDTQRAFDQLQKQAAPDSATAAPGEKKTFGSDFPKNGIKYTVKKGDNLWKIAQDYNSKISWIQDANKIARPADLQIGQVLFIPQQD